MGSLKAVTPKFHNTGGKREHMYTGKAPHPTPVQKVHDAGYTYANFAKSEPKTFGQGAGTQKRPK
jgi:hypothetical protein